MGKRSQQQPHELVVAVDMGGTMLKGALVDRSAEVVCRMRSPTPRSGTAPMVDRLVEYVEQLHAHGRRTGATVVGVGLVVPGIVDEEAEIAVQSANLGWKNLPLPDMLRSRIELPLAFGHDVRAACLAEVRLGSVRGVGNALFVPIGTGISAALVMDGELIRDSVAGEIGHVVVEPNGIRCACGGRGCLETVASTAAITWRYIERTGHQAADAAEVARMVEAGDPEAQAVWQEAITGLESVLAPCVAMLATELVVVGGGLAEAGSLLFDPLERALNSRLPLMQGPRVASARFGEWAGCIGAAMLAWGSDR